MKRLLSPLLFAGLLALPAAASAEPYHFVRMDGVRFDSQVGAVCGALSTEVEFGRGDTAIDIWQEAPLDFLANCIARGPLAGVRIDIVAASDGSDASLHRAYARQRAVLDHLLLRGVKSSQLTISREDGSGAKANRIRFRFADPAPWVMVYH
jgi:hypothetical protein